MYLRCRKQIECSNKPDHNVHVIKIPELGSLRGSRKMNIFHEPYYAFENIPYGYQPVDSLRFKAPLPAEKWEGTLDCTQYGNSPVLYDWDAQEVRGKEDCLNLNIYVRDIKRVTRYPVIVYIYGDGFGDGSADQYKPDYFMQHDVMLVIINYRGGPFGFVTFNDFELEVPGNAGLKDIVLALKWIHKHIRHFKGDSRNVTLMGQCSGAVLAHILMSTTPAKGLFQKAIIMSGSMFNSWSYLPQSSVPYRLALMNGYEGPDEERHILTYLNLLPAESLVGWHLLNFAQDSLDVLYPFAPTIESFETPEMIIGISYLNSIKISWGNHIPMLIGGTSFEGLYFYSRTDMLEMQKGNFRSHGYQSVLPSELCCLETDKRKKCRNIRLAYNLYFENGSEEAVLAENNSDNNEMLLRYLNLASMQYFWHGLHRTVLSRLLFATAQTYQYLFDFDSPDYNLYRQRYCSLDIKKGVAHNDELCYFFMQPNSWITSCDSAEYRTMQRMLTLWVEFARKSDPNCELLSPVIWKTVNESSSFEALIIGYALEFKELPDAKKLKAWDRLYLETPLQLD